MRLEDKLTASHEKLAAGDIYCPICRREYKVDAAQCFIHGWPKCCGITMLLGRVDPMKPAPGSPAKKGEVIFTYLHGPDLHGRYGFLMDWWQIGGVHYDTTGHPTEATEGPKGQAFFCDPKPKIIAARNRGEKVIEINKRSRD